MSEQQTTKFLPFQAINEFMLAEYRLHVLRTALVAGDKISPTTAARLNGSIKRHVQIPGFRNSLKAPPGLKLRHIIKPFENRSDLVAAVLSAWAEVEAGLQQKVFDLLAARGWELLPVDADRTRLPGFFTRWPVDENYDTIFTALQEAYPGDELSKDDIGLMTVWLSMRLPLEDSTSEAPLPADSQTP
jgi:hypothetical protein